MSSIHQFQDILAMSLPSMRILFYDNMSVVENYTIRGRLSKVEALNLESAG